ncbi:thioesterase family protein [Rhizobium sp. LC145]|uniref:acyl-CoA thioesterase n=1 Tax=Rhizobium sp. LC145 TaxID=1120688 RepID=UPI001FD87674|nr:thioesterase family protein [Rhizobium sp. LC145]
MAKEPSKLHEFQVPYRDVDMHGEMFRAAYVARAEEAVTEFWRRRRSARSDPQFTVSKVVCTFHEPLKLGDLVETHVGVSKIGGKSAGFLVHMERDGTAVAEAEIVWTACDPESREPIALPEDLRDWLYQFLD